MSGRLYTAIYDRTMGDAMFPVIRTSFEHWRRHFRLQFRSAADIGCGTGQFVLHLSKYTPRVYGIDSSYNMIKLAKRRNLGQNVTILRQDMRRFRLPQLVDLITANYDTLNYIISIRCLKRIFDTCNRGLAQSGHLYFDVLTVDGDSPPPGISRQQIRLPDVLSKWRIKTGTNGSEVMIDSIGRAADGSLLREKERHQQRWYSAKLLHRILCETGFKVLGTFKFGSREPANCNQFWTQFIARKVTDRK